MAGVIACPFCHAPQPKNALSMAPCPQCGRHPLDHPSFGVGAEGLDGIDDAPLPDLELDLPKTAPAPQRPVRREPPPPPPPEIDLAFVPPKAAGTPAAPSDPPPPAAAVSATAPPAAVSAAAAPPPPKVSSALTKAAHLVAKYPPAPTRRLDEPLYACRVLKRQIELRLDLDVLRRKRSPDVALYEEALRVHDDAAFRRGLAIVAAAFAVLVILFFMPVILRFAR